MSSFHEFTREDLSALRKAVKNYGSVWVRQNEDGTALQIGDMDALNIDSTRSDRRADRTLRIAHLSAYSYTVEDLATLATLINVGDTVRAEWAIDKCDDSVPMTFDTCHIVVERKAADVYGNGKTKLIGRVLIDQRMYSRDGSGGSSMAFVAMGEYEVTNFAQAVLALAPTTPEEVYGAACEAVYSARKALATAEAAAVEALIVAEEAIAEAAAAAEAERIAEVKRQAEARKAAFLAARTLATMADLERFATLAGMVLKDWSDEAIEFALTLPVAEAESWLSTEALETLVAS